MNIEIANRLQQLRKEKGYSQEELAQALGLSRQAVSKWERAESSPDTDNLICLARLYNISIDKLLDTNESMEEIKERIAQERINEIDKDKEDSEEVIDAFEKKAEDTKPDDPIDFFNEEENKLKKEADEKSGNVYLTLLGFGIIGYLIIGFNTHDWSWGWLLIVQALFGAGAVAGLYEEKHFSVVSFFFCLGVTLICIRDALWAEDQLAFVLTIISISVVSICSFTSFITFIIFASKNRKDIDIMYHKKRYMEQRDKFLEVKDKFDEFKKELDKMNK